MPPGVQRRGDERLGAFPKGIRFTRWITEHLRWLCLEGDWMDVNARIRGEAERHDSDSHIQDDNAYTPTPYYPSFGELAGFG